MTGSPLVHAYPPTGAKVSAGNGDHTPKFWDEETGALRAKQGGERVYVGYASVGIHMSVEDVKALMPDSALYEMIGNSMAAAVVGRVLKGVVREAANRRGDWFRPAA